MTDEKLPPLPTDAELLGIAHGHKYSGPPEADRRIVAMMRDAAKTGAAYAESALRTELAAARAQAQALRKLACFGSEMLHLHRGTSPCEVGDIDGGAAQDEAERCGVIEARTVTESCGESCMCVFDLPTTCYFVPDDVRAARAALDSARAAHREGEA